MKSNSRIRDLEEKIRALEKESADRRQVEASLRQSESLFRTLAEQSFAGIYVVQDGKFKYVNSNAAFYAGLTIEELTGRKSDSIVHHEDREDVKKNARAMLSGLLGKLDLVSREEFDIQAQVLLRTREKLKALEERVARLEGGSTGAD